MVNRPALIFINEVSPRDGFQIEPLFIPTADKIEYINALSKAGLAKIEVTSFVSPKAIPALADAAQVIQGIQRHPNVQYSALVPNVKGLERALQANVDEINFVLSATESHSQANLRQSRAQSLEQLRQILQLAGSVSLNVSISTLFGCPFEGLVAIEAAQEMVQKVVDTGARRIALCDTTGMANPEQVRQLASWAVQQWPDIQWTVHFHDTRGMGLANAYSAYLAGIRHFDASLGGLGGCPYAPGASGNVCTEDLVHMFEAMGLNTGVNLAKLLTIAKTLPSLIGRPISGHVAKAGPVGQQAAAAKLN